MRISESRLLARPSKARASWIPSVHEPINSCSNSTQIGRAQYSALLFVSVERSGVLCNAPYSDPLCAFSPVSLFLSLLNAQKAPRWPFRLGGIIEVQVRYATGQAGPRGIQYSTESAKGAQEIARREKAASASFRPTSGRLYRAYERARVQGSQVRIELIGNTQGYATIELKPISDATVAEHPAAPAGDSVSVIDATVPAIARQEFEKAQRRS